VRESTGLPHTPEEAGVILIPVPWDATASYGKGAALGPESILRASRQVDLFDRETGRPYEGGVAMLPISREVQAWNEEARSLTGENRARDMNALGDRLNDWVAARAGEWLERGRLVAWWAASTPRPSA